MIFGKTRGALLCAAALLLAVACGADPEPDPQSKGAPLDTSAPARTTEATGNVMTSDNVKLVAHVPRTPPLAIALIITSRIADCDQMKIFVANMPFLLAIVAFLIVLMLVPGLATWLPSIAR